MKTNLRECKELYIFLYFVYFHVFISFTGKQSQIVKSDVIEINYRCLLKYIYKYAKFYIAQKIVETFDVFVINLLQKVRSAQLGSLLGYLLS